MNNRALFDRLGGIRGVGGRELAPMTQCEIAALEKKMSIRLPEDYRHFLLTYGASDFHGDPPDNPYIVFRSLNPLPAHITDDDRGLFDAFYGGKSGRGDAYSLEVRIRFFSGRIPETMIPIGDDGGSGQICLGVKGDETGKVYYWDQENEPLDEEDYFEDYGEPRSPEAMFQNIYQIAESFRDFLQRLEIRKE